MNDPHLANAPSYEGNGLHAEGRSPATEPPYTTGVPPAPSPLPHLPHLDRPPAVGAPVPGGRAARSGARAVRCAEAHRLLRLHVPDSSGDFRKKDPRFGGGAHAWDVLATWMAGGTSRSPRTATTPRSSRYPGRAA